MATHPYINIHPIPTKDKIQHHPMPLHPIVSIKNITRRRIVLNLHSINAKTLPLYQTPYQQTPYQVQLILLNEDQKNAWLIK